MPPAVETGVVKNVKPPSAKPLGQEDKVTWQQDGETYYGIVQGVHTEGTYDVAGQITAATEDTPIAKVQLHTLQDGQLAPSDETAFVLLSDLSRYNTPEGQMNSVLSTTISEFRGKKGVDFPDIKLPEDVDTELLGPDKFYITLPIGRVGAHSRNGRVYSEQAIHSLVQQVNAKRPEGRWGHLKDEDRSTAYAPPAVRWLAAVIDDKTGIAWAKGIPVTTEAREHFRVAMAAHAKVGTSIYGTPKQVEGANVLDLSLETIDLADPSRVGVPDTASLVYITKEMSAAPAKESTKREEKREERMEEEFVKKIAELTQQLAAAQSRVVELEKSSARIAEMESSAKETEKRIKELEPAKQTVSACAELLKTEDVFKAVQEMVTRAAALETENTELLAEFITAEVAKQVKFESVRGLIEEMVSARKPATRTAVTETVKTVCEIASVKKAIEAQVIAESGPSVTKPITTPAEADKAFAQYFANPEVLAEGSK